MIKKYGKKLMRAVINLPKYVYSQSKVVIFQSAPYGGGVVNPHVQIDLLEVTSHNRRFEKPFLSPEIESLVRKRIAWKSRINDVCYLVLEQNQIVGYGWVRSSGKTRLEEIGLSLDLDSSQVCLYDFYIDNKARNRGIYRQFLWLLTKKYETCFGYAEASNAASCSGILAAGFLPLLAVSVVRVLGWKFPTTIKVLRNSGTISNL